MRRYYAACFCVMDWIYKYIPCTVTNNVSAKPVLGLFNSSRTGFGLFRTGICCPHTPNCSWIWHLYKPAPYFIFTVRSFIWRYYATCFCVMDWIYKYIPCTVTNNVSAEPVLGLFQTVLITIDRLKYHLTEWERKIRRKKISVLLLGRLLLCPLESKCA